MGQGEAGLTESWLWTPVPPHTAMLPPSQDVRWGARGRLVMCRVRSCERMVRIRMDSETWRGCRGSCWGNPCRVAMRAVAHREIRMVGFCFICRVWHFTVWNVDGEILAASNPLFWIMWLPCLCSHVVAYMGLGRAFRLVHLHIIIPRSQLAPGCDFPIFKLMVPLATKTFAPARPLEAVGILPPK